MFGGKFWNGILNFCSPGGIFSNGFDRGWMTGAEWGPCFSSWKSAALFICMRLWLGSLCFVPLPPPTKTLLLLKLFLLLCSFWFWFGYMPSEMQTKIRHLDMIEPRHLNLSPGSKIIISNKNGLIQRTLILVLRQIHIDALYNVVRRHRRHSVILWTKYNLLR